MARYCSRRVIEERKREDIDDDVLKSIDILTANMETLPVGTFKYKIFKYPGDVDLFEKLENCCTFNDSRLKSREIIQKIVNDVKYDKNLIFIEFKAGYDFRFKIYTGIMNDKIVDYNPSLIKRDIKSLYDAKLINKNEYHILMNLVKESPDVYDFIKLNEELRKYWVLRWSQEEVLRGYKVLRGNYRIYLDEALTQGSIVKLDTIAWINDQNRYVEMTNFFYIVQIDKYGNKIVLSEELKDYEQSLLNDVYKYYDKNTLKSIKRLWMYLNFNREICDLNLFNSLFESDISLYSQIVSDIEVAIDLLEKRKNFDTQKLYNSLKNRLTLLNGLCIDNIKFKESRDKNYKIMVENLKMLKSCLINFINEYTNEWLLENDIDIFNLI